jgi:hypothetical protein
MKQFQNILLFWSYRYGFLVSEVEIKDAEKAVPQN